MPPDARPSRGRPQDDDLTEQILVETRLQLELDGYAGLRIERIAVAVGCGKSAIYRRWRSRGELVAASMASPEATGTVPDTGSVVEDLILHVRRNVESRATTRTDSVIGAVVSPEVRDALWNDGFLSRRRRMGRQVLSRAIARGELPADADVDAILDVLAGFVFYRCSVRPAPITEDELRELIVSLASSPPHSRRRAAE